MGWLIRRLGFTKKHTGQGNGWIINLERLESWREIYFGDTIPLEKTSKTSQSSFDGPLSIRKSELSEVSEVFPEGITTQEMMEKLRPLLPTVFTEKKLVREMVALGLSLEESKKRFEHFKNKEIIAEDDIGGWHWNRR